MFRIVLVLLLVLLLVRAFRQLAAGVLQGLSGSTDRGVPSKGVQMVRDPVCGTYVLPERAVSLTEGSRRLFFCSDRCRDRFRSKKGVGSL
jgi:uncharacterized protein